MYRIPRCWQNKSRPANVSLQYLASVCSGGHKMFLSIRSYNRAWSCKSSLQRIPILKYFSSEIGSIVFSPKKSQNNDKNGLFIILLPYNFKAHTNPLRPFAFPECPLHLSAVWFVYFIQENSSAAQGSWLDRQRRPNLLTLLTLYWPRLFYDSELRPSLWCFSNIHWAKVAARASASLFCNGQSSSAYCKIA